MDDKEILFLQTTSALLPLVACVISLLFPPVIIDFTPENNAMAPAISPPRTNADPADLRAVAAFVPNVCVFSCPFGRYASE